MKKLALALLLSFALVADDYVTIEDQAKIELLNPALATRKTAKIRLKNGLEAYLISDPGVPQSGAAVAVEAGSWEDPKEYPGMAHFLEHMLFMGNAAYPKEMEYMWYISDHGGQNNAYTASDRTVYIFSINNDAFEGAMDRFSQFFISPLFLPSCIGRELKAVDQEHGKNIENDNWRMFEVLRETGNQNHPNAAFSTGNAKTLGGIPQEALKKWYGEQYSANRMHLCAVSSLPIDEMIALTVKNFSAVPTHPISPRNYPTDLLSDAQKGHYLYIKPIKDLKKLALVWQAPPQFAADQERSPLQLVSHILNSGANNSLMQVLKEEKLIESLHSSSDAFYKDQVLFCIDFNLTEKGATEIPTVIQRTFEALARLKEKGVPHYVFDETREMALVNYQHQSREDVFSFVTEQAANMTYEKLETYPEKTLIPSTYDPSFISAFIQTLTPSTCLYAVTANPSLTGVVPDTREKWMDAEYALKPIAPKELALWASAKPNPKIDLPSQNPYIPESLALVTASDQAPVLLSSDAGSKVYYIADAHYKVPEMETIFNIKSPLIDGSAKQNALFDLYSRALNEKLISLRFFGQVAGLDLSSGLKDMQAIFAIYGYSDKAPLFVKTIVAALKDVSPTQDHFEIYKKSLLSSYENTSKELPLVQANYMIANMMQGDAPLPSEKAKVLKTVTYEEFLAYSKNLFAKAHVSALFYGNLTEENAANLWKECNTTLAYAPYLAQEQNKKTVLVLPEKPGPFLISEATERQGNSVLLMLQQGPFSFEKKAAQQILSKTLREGFFDTLRTKQQTAYIAKAWDREIEKQLFQFFAVQSITHQPFDLLARFDLFLEDLLHNFHEKLSQERFETVRQNLIQTLAMLPENLEGMAWRYNTLAFDHDGDFAWVDKEIEGLKAISYKQVEEYAHEFFSRKNSKRIAVLVEGVLSPTNNFRYNQVTKEDVCGVGRYVSSR